MAEGGIPKSTPENKDEARIDESISEKMAEARIDESISENKAEARIDESISEKMAEGESAKSTPKNMAEGESAKSTPKPKGAFDGKRLFRSLRIDEVWMNGLAPKDPGANFPAWKAVVGRYETQYISTVATYDKALKWAKLSVTKEKIKAELVRIVEIDVEKMKKPNEEIINLTDPDVLDQVFPAKDNPNRNYATCYQQVLVKGHITSDCLRQVYPEDKGNDDPITKDMLKLKISE